MAGNQNDTQRNASPQPDRGPHGAPHGDDNTSGYDEKKPTSVAERASPDPTVPGDRPAQAGTTPTPSTPEPQDPDSPDINTPVPPGDLPSKTPVKEPERGEAQYVDDAPIGDEGGDRQAQFGDAARPIVPGPADGAD
jgi:hypothetical protein